MLTVPITQWTIHPNDKNGKSNLITGQTAIIEFYTTIITASMSAA